MKTLIGSMRMLLRSMPRRLNNHEKTKKTEKDVERQKKDIFLSSIVEANLKDITDIVDQKISDGYSGYL